MTEAAADDAAIALQDVTKRYGEGAAALDAVSLVVPRRQFLAIVGASGSGKPTLMRLINRLAEPTSGKLTIGGAEIRSLDPVALRRRIGYVFQEVGLFPHMTVAENIAITPHLLGWDETRKSARVDELLELVRLDRDYRDRFPAQLSGGERQRVGVARALAAGPEIVLMDEPFAALDPLTRDALGQDYRRLHDELRVTTVMITHDMLEALGLADRIIVMRAGRAIADGAASDLMRNDDDYVRELMQMPRKIAQRVGALLAGKER
jgi:osmoprotectant transport system ATP-binding protein